MTPPVPPMPTEPPPPPPAPAWTVSSPVPAPPLPDPAPAPVVERPDGEPDYRFTLRQARVWIDYAMVLHDQTQWAKSASAGRIGSSLAVLAQAEHATFVNEQMVLQYQEGAVQLHSQWPAEAPDGSGYTG